MNSGDEPVWPIRIGTIPVLADRFMARRASAVVEQAIESGVTAVLTQIVSGMGGVGKTQIAAAYAARVWAEHRVDLVLWANATSRGNIVTSYSRAAGWIGLEVPDPELGATEFLGWLADTTRSWLVVLDDLQHPGDLTNLWPPDNPKGCVVVTTRRRDAVLSTDHRRLIAVDVFTPAEAIYYLERKLESRPELMDEASLLAADLGHLPLALAQAATYMIDRGLTCSGYRRRLADRKRHLSDLVPEVQSLPDNHQDTIDVTWSLSIEVADRLRPTGLARPIIQMASILDPNGIPMAVFGSQAACRHAESSQRRGSARQVSSGDVLDSLHNLSRLSLISLDAERVTVHALVQRAVFDSLTDDERRRVALSVADALAEAWPTGDRNTALGQTLRSNASNLERLAGDYLWTSQPHDVLMRVGRSYRDCGLFSDAAEFWQRMVNSSEQRLGRYEPTTLLCRRNAATCRGSAGDAGGASSALVELVEDYLEHLGPDHPATLVTRHRSAQWKGYAGDPTSAEEGYSRLLTDCIRVQGWFHPETLSVRHNLAYWRGYAGDAEGAAKAFLELLPDYLRIMGPDFPGTLDTRASLADWQGFSGDPSAAAAGYAELVPDFVRVLGPDHPNTLLAQLDFACWKAESGQADVAVAELAELVPRWRRVVGRNHYRTLNTERALAYWIGVLGVQPESPTNEATGLGAGEASPGMSPLHLFSTPWAMWARPTRTESTVNDPGPTRQD